jgi:hypothetical protein
MGEFVVALDDPSINLLLDIVARVRQVNDMIANLPIEQREMMLRYLHGQMESKATDATAALAEKVAAESTPVEVAPAVEP